MTYPQMQKVLQDLRANPSRCSEVVHYCGHQLLKHYAKALGDEVWVINEQVLMASLDCHRIRDAEECWARLATRFSGGSRRVRRLHSLILEAKEQYDEADQCYKDLLEETQRCDKQAFKRRVAIAKARGHRADAISRMEEYLAVFQVDDEAQHELADLYLTDCDYGKAAGCFEEMILGDPHNFLFMLKYAEVLYSIGEKRPTEEARKYFAQSIRLNDSVRNLRAFYGLWICCIVLATQFGMRDNAENNDVLDWVSRKLRAMYQCSAPQRLAGVDRMLRVARPEDS
eukprot:GGOE01043531.1.p1 GENE.GGOE01043531.1~~GGOE01043531.1.p1  ORF type:complete len:315 (+),score=92.16 GGOE01043531.1:91-945(+)